MPNLSREPAKKQQTYHDPRLANTLSSPFPPGFALLWEFGHEYSSPLQGEQKLLRRRRRRTGSPRGITRSAAGGIFGPCGQKRLRQDYAAQPGGRDGFSDFRRSAFGRSADLGLKRGCARPAPA